MFGANATLPRAQVPGETLLVQGDPFHTIQGEGPFAGMPAVFIRLWGCHLKCWFCDTDFESDQRATLISDLVEACIAKPAPLVVLTGGEPMRQYLTDLVTMLLDENKLVQIETAGSFWMTGMTWDHVVNHRNFCIVVSPKTPAVHPSISATAKAWKYIMSADYVMDPDDGLPLMNTQEKGGRLHRLARPPWGTDRDRIYLQPMDQGSQDKTKANTRLCVETAMKHGYRVSTQLHKQWGLP